MKRQFDQLLPRVSSYETAMDAFTHPYMSYWYGGLYVVTEGWQELGLSDPEIDSLLTSEHVDLLRRYRNGCFHFQADYFDERFRDFIARQGSVGWISSLHEAFSRWFLAFFQPKPAQDEQEA